ncbi:hypothetical protein [Streptomyces decoyicus]|uniref:hypothetical protein n=1 Tax=Streptomyces decoyicus TaxID=249567 RepID=UPI0033B81E8F
MSKAPMIRTTTVAALLLAVAPLWALPRAAPSGRVAECAGRRIASWSVDSGHTAEFARYGDVNARMNDWTGGDGTHSVRLPDGRTVWLFSDTFLDRIQPPPNPQGQKRRWRTADTGGVPLLRHNSAAVMSRSGRPVRTLTGGTAAASGPFFPGSWRFRDGAHWRRQAGRAGPVLRAGGRRGVGSAFTVVRDGPAWVLITMDTGGDGAAGIRASTSYWSCSPHGPWHGPDGRLTPPRPPAPDPQHVAVYNPQIHPEFTANREFLLSYDVNWLGPPGVPADPRVNGDVELYRPRFLRVRMGPAGR